MKKSIPNLPQLSCAIERSPDRPRMEMRRRRSLEPENSIGMRLRPEENTLLLEVGRFRVIASADLCRALYAGNDGRMKRDLAYLRQNRLIDVHVLTARRDRRSAATVIQSGLLRRERDTQRHPGPIKALAAIDHN